MYMLAISDVSRAIDFKVNITGGVFAACSMECRKDKNGSLWLLIALRAFISLSATTTTSSRR